jgi:hypothetical protein
MVVVSSLITAGIFSQMNANKLTGRDGIKIADAIGTSVASYLMTPNLVSCTLSGTAGPIGNINSIAVAGLVPKAMSSLMVGKAASKKLKGRDIMKLCDSISNGIVQVLQGMVLSGTAVGIAVGGGVGSFTALSDQALSKLMLGLMQGKKINGRDIAGLCDSISFGVVNHLKTSVRFTTVVTGVIAPVPPVGPVAVAGIPSVFTKIS